MTEQANAFLIVKRGLFWRPNGQGYTGIRDHAGRYSEEAARYHAEHGQCTIIHEDEAPEFMAAAFNDLIIEHLTKQRDEFRTRAMQAEAALAAKVSPHAG